MTNRRVLIITYYFPPISSGGTFRLLKFAKYLPEFGWDPIVVCARPTEDDHIDHDLTAELPQSVIVERVGHFHPKQIEKGLLTLWKILWKLRLRAVAARLEPYKVLQWLPPDPYLTWIAPVFRTAKSLVHQYRPDLIVTSAPPHSVHLIGLWLKRTTDLPWVADFRDPWSQNPFVHFPTKLHANLAGRMEKAVFSHADHIITVTKSMTDQMSSSSNGKYACKISTIENGFDAVDFEQLRATHRRSEALHIAYVGSLYGIQRADLFLACVDRLIESNQIPAEHLLVELIGKDGTGIVAEYEDRVWFRHTPPQPHAQALHAMASADLLLLLVPPGASYIHSGKLFEYLGACRPILALAPLNSEAAQVVLAAHAGVVVPPDDDRAVSAAILQAYREWEDNRLCIHPDLDVVSSFDRRHLTKKLSEILNQLVESDRATNA